MKFCAPTALLFVLAACPQIAATAQQLLPLAPASKAEQQAWQHTAPRATTISPPVKALPLQVALLFQDTGEEPPAPPAGKPDSNDPPSGKAPTEPAAEPAAGGGAGKATPTVPPATATAPEADLQKQLEVVESQFQSAKDLAASLSVQAADKQAELQAVRKSGPEDSKPYSFLLLDTLRDELASRKARSETLQATTENAAEEVKNAKQQMLAAEQKLRQLKTAPQPSGATAAAQQTAEIKLAAIEVKIARQTLALKQQEQQNELKTVAIHNQHIELLELKTAWIEKDVSFSPTVLQDLLVELDKQEADIKNALRTAEANQRYAEDRWSEARQKLDADGAGQPQLLEQVEARMLEKQLRQQHVTHLNGQLQRVAEKRELWRQRFQVINAKAEPGDLITWSEDAEQLQQQLGRDKRLSQLRIDEIRQEVSIREKQLQNATDDGLKRWLTQQRNYLEESIQLHNKSIVEAEETQRLAEKLAGEVSSKVGAWSPKEWFEGARHYALQAWNTELMTIEEQPLTIGSVLMGLILLVAGFFIARILSRILGRRLKEGRVQMNESGAAALQTVSFYLIFVLCTLTALRIVNVPLTVFTFFGGAIAIGVGLGSQNIVNNFISGLVLLAERPIKVGDLIKIDGLYGNVEHIGARSTRIRTSDNLEIIVPNSTFLENNVVNLTRGDKRVRTKVVVGVAYGSPTREVAKLLKHAADNHGQILKRPAPHVWFADFADSSLNFELYFWVEVRTVGELRRVESDIRHHIDQIFREAHVEIAFPQRDVHLDVSSPVNVNMLPPADNAAGGTHS